jgi:hypothetical protein
MDRHLRLSVFERVFYVAPPGLLFCLSTTPGPTASPSFSFSGRSLYSARMDWKYKHFHQERTWQASPEAVVEAARQYLSESLGWNVTNAADGLRAEGSSAAHAAIADFRIQSAGSGTKIGVDLLVKRAGLTGFMLFDVGGYYNIQIRKWLDGIQSAIHVIE